MKKIFLFITQMESGGAQMAIIRLTRQLIKRGYDPHLFFFYKKRPIPEIEVPYTIISNKSPKHAFFIIELIFRFLILFVRKRPDAVITFTYYANIIAQLFAFFFKIPKRIASQRCVASSYPKFAGSMDKLLGVLGVYTHNIMVSKAVLKSFELYPSKYLKNTRIVINGLKPNRLLSLEWNIRDTLKISGKNLFLIICIGRLSTQKNHKVVVNAIAEIPDAHLLILGDGELKNNILEHLKKLNLSSKVTIMGEIPNTQVIPLISQCDAFAFPSLFEGMSNALIESLFAKIPVLASDIPPNRDVLLSENAEPAGLLLPPEDVNEWKKALLNVKNNPDLNRALCQRAGKVSARFSQDRMAAGFESCLND